MLDGTCGASPAWTLTEPHFNDLVTFTGKIEEINPDAEPNVGRETPIKGSMRVSGVTVYFLPGITRILERNTKNLLPFNQLATDQVVTVYGESPEGSHLFIALAVRTQDPNARLDSSVDVSDLSLQKSLVALLLFPVVAGMVGLFIGGVEGIICRTYSRAVSSAVIGLIAGLIGGAISLFAVGLVFGVLGKVGPRASM